MVFIYRDSFSGKRNRGDFSKHDHAMSISYIRDIF